MRNFESAALAAKEQTFVLGGHRGGGRSKGGDLFSQIFGTSTKPSTVTDAETALKTLNDTARTELKTNGSISDATKTALKAAQISLMQAKLDWLKTL